MELILLRHGKADDFHPEGDFHRCLVERGRAQAVQAGRLMSSWGRLPDLVLSSPRHRAKETAELFCRAAGLDEPLIQPWLDCGMHPDLATDEMMAFVAFKRVMLVGHEPDFSALANTLLGCAGAGVEVKKGTMVGLDVKPPGWRARLAYLLPSKALSAI